MRRRMRAWLAAVLVVGACGTAADPASDALSGDAALLVAGASDLRPAFAEIGELFTAETGHEVIFDFGSSGQLAQRIIEGAPVDVYASANVSFVDEVLDSGVGDPDTKATYAFGRITIWSVAETWGGWTDLDELVADPDIAFLAIANPEHAPYGLAAKEALVSAGTLGDDRAQTRLRGEHLRHPTSGRHPRCRRSDRRPLPGHRRR
jgi:molybdate transport system substrate-binding protein